MTKVVDLTLVKYKDPGDNCFFAVLGTYLATMGIPLQVVDLIFGHGLNYFLREEDGDLYLFNHATERISKFLQANMEIDISYHEEANCRTAWELVRDRIDKNVITIISTSIYYLHYLKNYRREHLPHYLFVMGYDLEAENILVEDVYFDYKGNVMFEDFISGRSIEFYNRRNMSLEITCPMEIRDVHIDLFKQQLRENKENLIGTVKGDWLTGLNAITTFKEWVTEKLNYFEKNTIIRCADSAERCWQELKRHLVFLQYLGHNESLIECVSNMSRQWEILMNLFIKTGIKRGSVSADSMRKILESIIKLIEEYIKSVGN